MTERKSICITDKEKCCGCAACVNVCPCDAITLETDELGFAYPRVIDEKCVNCGKCVSVCDFGKSELDRAFPLKAFAAANKCVDTLCKSSSGGVFSAVADYVLENGGAVCGCALKELSAVHICIEKKEDMPLLRRSKYLQSDMGLVYREVKERLEKGQMVLFSGSPCHVAALYGVLGKEYEKLITMDLVCHGVPSAEMFKKYIKYLEQKYRTKIVDFNFRSKKYGWQRWTTEFTTEAGKTKNIGKLYEFYIPAFTGGNMMRPSCFKCKYACPTRVGDITVADFWGHEKANVSFNTQNGVSLCALNTEKAVALASVLGEKMHLQEIDYNIAVAGNRCLHAPTEKGKKWELYMQAFKEDKIPEIAARYKKSHKKVILRNRLKSLVPTSVFMAVRKKKYGNKPH